MKMCPPKTLVLPNIPAATVGRSSQSSEQPQEPPTSRRCLTSLGHDQFQPLQRCLRSQPVAERKQNVWERP